MTSLIEHIPDVDTLLAIQPEEIVRIFLQLIAADFQSGMFHPGSITSNDSLFCSHTHDTQQRYPIGNRVAVAMAAGEGWHWLELNMLIMPAPDSNGRNGYRVLTRRGRRIRVLTLVNQDPCNGKKRFACKAEILNEVNATS